MRKFVRFGTIFLCGHVSNFDKLPKEAIFGFCKIASTVGKMTDKKNFSDMEKLPDVDILPISKNCAQKRIFFGFRKIASLHVSLIIAR